MFRLRKPFTVLIYDHDVEYTGNAVDHTCYYTVHALNPAQAARDVRLFRAIERFPDELRQFTDAPTREVILERIQAVDVFEGCVHPIEERSWDTRTLNPQGVGSVTWALDAGWGRQAHG